MIVFPNAKINLGLNITQRRPDGYHNLETIFYPLMIKDALEIIESDALSFQSSGIHIPGDRETNLCLKAYQLLKQDFDLPPVSIHLHKHIPIGAGLGGGSADAAFMIKLLNQQFELGLTPENMMNYARQLGADCAFFINNEPVYAFDKGDRFEPVELNLSRYCLVLVMPPVHVSTAEAYGGITPKPVEVSLKNLIQQPISHWKTHIKNDFEEHIFKAYPVIAGVKSALYQAGAIYASMSGSGASVFGVFEKQPVLSALAKSNQVFYNV
ncbi:4-(cytidine 5'-diphospho)-2-C-methyl-D-erythritol kinase [Mucilaginibacter sp. CSA2-8R]|uniref:4-(cytidine 5'-diphospho)-2-C-methyl-D-erythritol kinase n=1 Tax=Mucilaginibacter sp. CSA2-8R TaxID=3141542 RepID=UPI00315C9B6A